ncbi:MAG: septum site-determining protein MinC [Moraxella sp.]|nr:septum site-determining protein MinC [Moraxella sp.]
MSEAVSLYGKMLAFSRLKVRTADMDAITEAVRGFNHDTLVPAIIESDEDLDLAVLIDTLWDCQVAVIGVVDGVLSDKARELKMAIFPNDGKRIARLDDKPKKEEKSKASAETAPDNQGESTKETQDKNTAEAPKKDAPALAENTETKPHQTPEKNTEHEVAVVGTQGVTTPASTPVDMGINSFVQTQMVRSGQSLHHMGGDLIITASVNQGAEVATDYNLHIYGKGQGRLVAGATGDENARIFCQKFEPSLVSVAGTYCLKDDIPAEMIGQAVEVSFFAGKLVFKQMTH